jgi:F-type H+-transporting ATPase subunit a
MIFLLPPIAAEPVLHLGGFVVTNSVINGWISVLLLTLLAVFVRLGLGKKGAPARGRVARVADWLVEELQTLAEQVTGGNKEAAARFLPLAAGIFFFVLFNNWLGLLPGTGSLGVWQLHEGHMELIPLLRPASADLNLTLAIAALAVLSTHLFGITAIGVWKHANKFLNVRGLWHGLTHGPMAFVIAVIEFGVGLIEIVGEVAKTLSLSLRLFGNVFAGEVLLTVMAGLIAYAVPVPFLFLELLVGLIQAAVFAILTLAFCSVAVMEPHGGDAH